MTGNLSPWLHQLKRMRPVNKLTEDASADVAIVGGGIAGIVTAYYALKNTSTSVILLEAYKVSHGATGHNAGQLVSRFERPFLDIAEEFGAELAAKGEKEIESAWRLLDEIYADARLSTPMSQFMGYDGSMSLDQVLDRLKTCALRVSAELPCEAIYLASDAPDLGRIPAEYAGLYQVTERENILSLLETKDSRYIAAFSMRKGCLNSALFTEELAGYLVATYPARFMLAEHSGVERIVLRDGAADLVGKEFSVTAGRVVLCTNGFEKITLENTAGPDIDEKFHHEVRGIIGYMAGYIEPLNRPPTAISYIPEKFVHQKDIYLEEPYFYLTRRPYELEKSEIHNLVCVGGPQESIEETHVYAHDRSYPEAAWKEIDAFLHKTHLHSPKEQIEFKFKWHGLMGYTPNGIRLIGPEPANPVLLYNLGCNGIGILPSVYGGRKIADFLSGAVTEPSIFDPRG
ncbi:FAD-binding oxidoreductase [Candidatus Parcubacteria bacterium]|nr:FAD-binding oxidoreductase [Candidatus Parcubacteria bacterium]